MKDTTFKMFTVISRKYWILMYGSILYIIYDIISLAQQLRNSYLWENTDILVNNLYLLFSFFFTRSGIPSNSTSNLGLLLSWLHVQQLAYLRGIVYYPGLLLFISIHVHARKSKIPYGGWYSIFYFLKGSPIFPFSSVDQMLKKRGSLQAKCRNKISVMSRASLTEGGQLI